MFTLKLSLNALVAILLIRFFPVFFFSNSFAQTTNLIFSEPDPFCSLDDTNCTGLVEYPFSIATEIPDGLQVSYELQLDGGTPGLDTYGMLNSSGLDFNIAGDYPIGDHRFWITVGNTDGTIVTEELPFSVVDCQIEEVVCLDYLAVMMYPVEPGTDADGDGDEDEGASVIWAVDFVTTAVNDCSEPLIYSINRVGEMPDINQNGLVVTCDDPDFVMVEIYVWDGAYNPYSVQPDSTLGGPNYTSCQVLVELIDGFFDVCFSYPSPPGVDGTVLTEVGQASSGVVIQLSGDAAESFVTGSDGQFFFSYLSFNGDYSITPEYDLYPENGVSTLDLIKMTQHILGVQSLASPYKLIAADVNNSQSLTTLDVIHAKKVILNIEDEFPNNTSWRFIDASYVFPNPVNPWLEDFPEVININNISGYLPNLDFVAIKIGDVNHSAQ